MDTKQMFDAVVVGGGLSGLTAATVLARAGHRVTLLEKSSSLGGRAMTTERDGFFFNFGPHALYLGGATARLLRELGVAFEGGAPPRAGLIAVYEGRLSKLPSGFWSLFSTELLSWRAKIRAARLLTDLNRLDAKSFDGVSVRAWLDGLTDDAALRGLLAALVRLNTYTNAEDLLSAGAAIRQIQIGINPGVLYLHRGWQSIVDGLRRTTESAGVVVRTGVRAVNIRIAESAVSAVETATNESIGARGVIVAATPDVASSLVSGGSDGVLRGWAECAVPVRAACLDLALRRLPNPRVSTALGIDTPIYFSPHSSVAQLAPEGAATALVAKYLPSGDTADPHAIERELEAFVDLVQPGWRDDVVNRRFLPKMIVTHALARADAGGLPGRPAPCVRHVKGLYVAGDWVGGEGVLSDVGVSSAHQAANELAAQLANR